ncbi:MAG: SMP-30/gluconolactonase/LRE family protein [Planctomycetes bacterium]|nr:SMP-30/gluconolactonase/LRE family protein [Planctomycetota bacterium]
MLIRSAASLTMAVFTMFQAEKPLEKAVPLTKPGEFTSGIEGPACGPAGDIFAVNYGKQGTIGRVTPDGKGEIWVTLPAKSVGNGIVFNKQGKMFVADYTGHNILRIDPASKNVEVFAHNPQMNQPNDLAISEDGTLWASDPNWGKGTGQLWRIDANGSTRRVAEDMGTTNGIEVSPDGKILYVNESVQRNLWAFPILPDKTLGQKKLLTQFPDHGFDGMRADAAGNLHVTRHGKGTVAIVSPKGEVIKEIEVLGKNPTNICFGGPEGKTAYVTEVDGKRIVSYRWEVPGLAWQRLNGK